MSTEPRAKRVAVYLRVSTDEQREKQTIQTQRQHAEQHTARENVVVHDYYADDGVSGTIPFQERPAGARLMDDARAGLFDTVLVYKLDRLGRDSHMTVTLNAVNDLNALGVRVESMTEPFDATTPAGRFMLNMLANVAGYERDTIIQRSMDGTNRLAREGAWLGGIVPYGYRVEGKGREARLVVSEEPIPGTSLTEGEVVRLIFRLLVEEGQSCVKIAAYLTALGVPPAYVRDSRAVLRGKRKQATSGIWRPGRIRNLIVSTTYKGVHQYGRRSRRKREIIERTVPAIVSEEVWDRAQQALKSNQLFSSRNAKRRYLLRGLLKCGLCGLTYVGTTSPDHKGGQKVYYVCNGKQSARGIYGLKGERCPSKGISGDIEDVVWQDIEGFRDNPGDALCELAERQREHTGDGDRVAREVAALDQTLAAKTAERDRMLTLYRRGRIDDADLDRQLDAIDREQADLKEQLARLQGEQQSAEASRASLRSAEELLRELHETKHEPMTWEQKRQVAETLVIGGIVETTIDPDGRKEAMVNLRYAFTPAATRTGRGSSPPPASRWQGTSPYPAPG